MKRFLYMLILVCTACVNNGTGQSSANASKQQSGKNVAITDFNDIVSAYSSGNLMRLLEQKGFQLADTRKHAPYEGSLEGTEETDIWVSECKYNKDTREFYNVKSYSESCEVWRWYDRMENLHAMITLKTFNQEAFSKLVYKLGGNIPIRDNEVFCLEKGYEVSIDDVRYELRLEFIDNQKSRQQLLTPVMKSKELYQLMQNSVRFLSDYKGKNIKILCRLNRVGQRTDYNDFWYPFAINDIEDTWCYETIYVMGDDISDYLKYINLPCKVILTGTVTVDEYGELYLYDSRLIEIKD